VAAKSPSGAAPAEERNHLYASRPAAVIYATGATEVLNKLPGAAFTQSEGLCWRLRIYQAAKKRPGGFTVRSFTGCINDLNISHRDNGRHIF